MKTLRFKIGYLRYLMRRADVFEYQLGSTEEEIEQKLEAALDELNSPDYQLQVAKTKRVKNEFIFIPRRFADKLFLRHINLRLCRLYRVKHANREQIVRQVGELLKADVPVNILRTDVRRFFRNVDFHHLINRLRVDGLLHAHELNILKQVADQTAEVQVRGVPWGLPISSTLAEIYMHDFDAHLRRIQGVYYYQRFVDDIILFSSVFTSEVLSKLKVVLKGMPHPLNLNEDKTIQIDESATIGKATILSYLGYDFARSKSKKREEAGVKITIQEAKLEKLRNRIRLSISQFKADRHTSTGWRDLKARLKLLTGNYEIKKSSHKERIKTGIFYNYSAINDTGQLSEMDVFLKSQLIGLRNWLKRANHTNDKKLLRQLFTYSFLTGFKERKLHSFTRDQLERLFRPWQNEK